MKGITGMKGAKRPRVLIVDDDALLRQSLVEWLGLMDIEATAAKDADDALARFAVDTPHLVLTDIRMPGRSGLDLMAAILAKHPGLPVVLMTGHGDVPLAVQAMREGAHDFLTKPYDPEHLLAVIRRGIAMRRQQLDLRELQMASSSEADHVSARLLGESTAILSLRRDVRRLAKLPLDIVLYGETGSGKDVAALAIHAAGARASGPFVAVNCAAIPMDLAEGELFGHEDGAFTGTKGARIGRFEAAHGGTLFLDEIESMPLLLQVKVLRVVQEKCVERLGSVRSRPLDLRIIAASKANLRQMAERGEFRSDLYFRLAQTELHLPPLRERDQDSLMLFEFFVAAASAAQGLPAAELTASDRDALIAYGWPGNVRELKLVAERFAFGLIEPGKLAANLGPVEPNPVQGNLNERLDHYERVLIQRALKSVDNSISEAAEILGIPRRTLGDKMTRLGLK